MAISLLPGAMQFNTEGILGLEAFLTNKGMLCNSRDTHFYIGGKNEGVTNRRGS